MLPPSDSGISRLSPAPEAAEPYVTSEPGNLFVTDSSTPDSAAAVTVSKHPRLGAHEASLLLSLAPVRRLLFAEVVSVEEPCFMASEFRSRSACWASLSGSCPSYSADMMRVLCCRAWFVRCYEWSSSGRVGKFEQSKTEVSQRIARVPDQVMSWRVQ